MASGRGPLAVIPAPQPVEVKPQPVEVKPMTSKRGRLPMIRRRSPSIRWPLAAGRYPLSENIGQGPPPIGSSCADQQPTSAIRRAWPRAYETEARAMFLANNYYKI